MTAFQTARFNRRARSATACLTGSLVAVILSACGGSGGSAVAGGGGNNSGDDVLGVFAGFSGDPNWVNGGLGDGVGEGADGDGGVGVGGALGQFRNAQVLVTLEDGSELGSALIDDSGMVTVRPGRSYAGALLIELRGGNGAEYFDEAKGVYVSFDAGQVLRSRVPTVARNIGVTPLTDAAASYMDANPNAATGIAQRITESLRVVRDATNNLVPGEFDLPDITIVPTLLNPSSGQGSAPDTTAGRYALLLAAAAKLAGANNPDLSRPALAFSQQLSTDLTDGVIDGVGINGEQAATIEQAAYRHNDLARDLSTAVNSASDEFGVEPAVAAAREAVQYGLYSVTSVLTGSTTLLATLYDNGEVGAQVRSSGGALGVETNIASGINRMFSGVDNLATNEALLLQQSDGKVLGFGLNAEPSYRLATDQLTVAAGQELSPLANLRSIAFGSNHQVALDTRGEVVVWGSNDAGQLDGTALTGSASPIVLGGLGQPAFYVGATANVSLAAVQDGTVLSWGSDPAGGLGQGEISGEFVAPGRVQTSNGPLIDVVAFATCFRTVNALRRDGSVWAWGDNSLGLLGTISAARAIAAPIPGLPAIQKVVMAFDGAYGLARDGDVWYWGLNANGGQQLPIRVSGLSNVRDMQTTGLNGAVAKTNFGGTTFLAYGAVSG